jgi:PAS domain S-box-containing protein
MCKPIAKDLAQTAFEVLETLPNMEDVRLTPARRFDRFLRICAAFLVIVLAVLAWVDWRASKTAVVETSQIRQILQTSLAFLSVLKDAETGQRGYLLTGDARYLTPYRAAVSALPHRMTDLLWAGQAVKRPPAELAEIQQLTRSKLEELRLSILARDQEGPGAALAIVRTDQGRETMDRIRQIMGGIEREESDVLLKTTQARSRLRGWFRLAVVATCAGLLLILFRMDVMVNSLIGRLAASAKAAHDERERFETTLRSIGDGVIATDSAGAVRFLNRVAEDLTGWSQEEAAGRELEEVFRIFSESTREKAENPVQKVLKNAGVVGLANHTVLLTKGGLEVPIDDSGAPIRGSDGEIAGVVLVFRDITERRAIELELEFLRRMFASVSFGMFIVEIESMTVRDLNPAFAALHGYRFDELIGKPFSKIAPAALAPGFVATLRQAVEDGRAISEQIHQRKDGSTFEGLLDVASFTERQTTFVAGYCADISGRRRLEDTLRESEERFRTLAGALPQLVWSSDSTGTIQYVNPHWRTYAGWSEEAEIPGDPWETLLHPEDRQDYLGRWKSSIATGSEFEVQARLKRQSDGSYRWFLCRCSALKNREGKTIRWLGSCTDIDDQMKTATELGKVNEALRASNADLEQFAYAASHDLREPLRMVSIYSQLLREEYSQVLDDKAAAYIDFAVKGARRMEGLLKDLLAYSRMSNDETDRGLEADANTAVRLAMLNLAASIEQKKAVVTIEDLPRVCIAEVHLVQLFQNLIGNALKYGDKPRPEGESLTVDIGAKREKTGEWMFWVRDNGIGIDSEYHQQIFGVFRRLHGQGVEGTGIGLALCQRIVEKAGGKIWVESQAARGSTFFFTLLDAGNVA